MPNKKGYAPTSKVASSWGKETIEELGWFSRTLGVKWSDKVRYDMSDYSTMEIDPYKVVYYDLSGKGPEGEKAEATILVTFKHDYEKPAGYDSNGRGYVKWGIEPEVIRPSRNRWIIDKTYITVRFEEEELSPREYYEIIEEAKNIRGDLGKSQLDRLKGIKELDWD